MNRRVIAINKCVLGFSILIFFVLVPFCLALGQELPREENGIIDLRGFDLDQQVVSLDGEWKFFWNQLLKPEDFLNENQPPYQLIEVPRAWNDLEVAGELLPTTGFATYRALFLVDQRSQLMGIEVPRVLSSFRLWANGQEITGAGKVGTEEKETIPEVGPRTAFLPVEGEELELIIQVANFNHGQAGLVESLTLGPAGAMITRAEMALAYDFLLMGGLLIAGLFHLLIYFFRRQRASFLYFGIFCLLLGIRTFFAGEGFLVAMDLDFPWNWSAKIQSLGYFLGVGAAVLLLKNIFPKFMHRIWVVTGLFSVGVFSLAAVIAPAGFFAGVKPVFHIIALGLGVFAFWALIKGVRQKEAGAILLFFGSLVLIGSVIHDFIIAWIFSDPGFLFFGQKLFNGGLLVFVLTGSLALGQRGIKELRQKEKTALEIQGKNHELEAQFIDRIKDIELANDKIEQQEGEIERAHQALQKISLRDPLTESWNRRYFEEILGKEWERAMENKTHLSLIFLDIDDFHSFNQKYGHRVGDNLLISIARTLSDFSRRPGEIAARYGGEEFVFLLPETTLKRALEIGENIRKKIENLYLFHASSRGYTPVTVSMGIASTIPDESSIPESLIAQAENAMFRAKEEGKNRIETDFSSGE